MAMRANASLFLSHSQLCLRRVHVHIFPLVVPSTVHVLSNMQPVRDSFVALNKSIHHVPLSAAFCELFLTFYPMKRPSNAYSLQRRTSRDAIRRRLARRSAASVWNRQGFWSTLLLRLIPLPLPAVPSSSTNSR